jgi:hypothetical protein
VWFSAHGLAAVAYGVRGLGRAGSCLLRYLLARRPPAAEEAPAIGRREFLQQAGVVGVAAPFAFAISLSGVPLSYDFRVERRDLEVPNWPRALDGLRVAHLSDIHVGGAMDGARLREVAALVAAERPGRCTRPWRASPRPSASGPVSATTTSTIPRGWSSAWAMLG